MLVLDNCHDYFPELKVNVLSIWQDVGSLRRQTSPERLTFLETFNWWGKDPPWLWQNHSMDWCPQLNNKKKASWAVHIMVSSVSWYCMWHEQAPSPYLLCREELYPQTISQSKPFFHCVAFIMYFVRVMRPIANTPVRELYFDRKWGERNAETDFCEQVLSVEITPHG